MILQELLVFEFRADPVFGQFTGSRYLIFGLQLVLITISRSTKFRDRRLCRF